MGTSSQLPPARRTGAIYAALILALLSALLPACGGPPGAHGQPSPVLLTASTGTTVSPLHVQMDGGMACWSGTTTILSDFTSATSNLVLMGNPAAYDTGTLQRLDTFLGGYLYNHQRLDGLSAVSLPQGLAWAYGAIAGANAGCTTTLEVTNVGSSQLQVQQIDLRLTGAPQPNTRTYPLVDICSFPSYPFDVCTGWGASAGPCSVLAITLALRQASAGSVISAPTSTSDASCPSPTLNPGDSVSLALTITSTGTPDNLSYPVVPEITVQDQSGQHIITLSRFATTLAFANASQFTCYGDQNGTLMATTDAGYSARGNEFCQ